MKNFVLAITPSPALDLSGTVDNLKPNEKSYVHDEVKSPGGNAVNAARILSRLKVPVLATGFLGGSIGDEIKRLLDKEKVKSQFIKIKDDSRICVTVSNTKDHQQTRLTFPGPHILGSKKKKLFQFVEKQKHTPFLLIGGSMPPGFDHFDIALIIKLAKENGTKCIVDSPGTVLKNLIASEPFFIKPNLVEFQELTRSNVKSVSGVLKKAQVFSNKIPYICISSVAGGALLVTEQNSYFGRTPKVKIKSTVGAGDSMVGAMVAQFYKKNTSADELLRWGLAAAAATLEKPGTAFGSARRIYQLYEKTKVVAIKK